MQQEGPGLCFSRHQQIANSLLLALRGQVGAAAVGHFGGHAQAFAQGGVGVDGLADVDGVGAHFNGQGDFANHIARVGADDAAADDAVAGFVKQELGKALVAAIGDGAAGVMTSSLPSRR